MHQRIDDRVKVDEEAARELTSAVEVQQIVDSVKVDEEEASTHE